MIVTSAGALAWVVWRWRRERESEG
jgi:hypothetical protein